VKKCIYILLLFCACATQVLADGVVLASEPIEVAKVDTGLVFIPVSTPLPAETPVKSSFQPDPDMAVWLAAVVPGLGQIYNRQYWKLPIVYGGAMGLGYAISWNNQMYIDYRKAYVDLIDADPNSTFYTKVLPNGVVIDASNKDYYTRTLKNKQDAYQRNRDLCIICTGVLYLLTLIDAYVDAQMADYDISPDLSLQVAPAVLPPSQYQQTDTSIGLRCKLKF
jgi:hypothetical protein